jgi:hypothetical protein
MECRGSEGNSADADAIAPKLRTRVGGSVKSILQRIEARWNSGIALAAIDVDLLIMSYVKEHEGGDSE